MKRLLATSLILGCAALAAALPAWAQSDFTGASDILNQVAGPEGAGYNTAEADVNATISTVIFAFFSLMGAIFLILMVYAGFTWMLARGNDDQARKAMDTIRMAIIGLIIVIGAYAITAFVVGQF